MSKNDDFYWITPKEQSVFEAIALEEGKFITSIDLRRVGLFDRETSAEVSATAWGLQSVEKIKIGKHDTLLFSKEDVLNQIGRSEYLPYWAFSSFLGLRAITGVALAPWIEKNNIKTITVSSSYKYYCRRDIARAYALREASSDAAAIDPPISGEIQEDQMSALEKQIQALSRISESLLAATSPCDDSVCDALTALLEVITKNIEKQNRANRHFFKRLELIEKNIEKLMGAFDVVPETARVLSDETPSLSAGAPGLMSSRG